MNLVSLTNLMLKTTVSYLHEVQNSGITKVQTAYCGIPHTSVCLLALALPNLALQRRLRIPLRLLRIMATVVALCASGYQVRPLD